MLHGESLSLSIYSSIHYLFIYPSTRPFIHLSIYSSILPFTCPSIHSFTHHSFIHSSTHTSICSFIHSSIPLSFHPPIYPSIHLFTHSFIYSFIYSSIYSYTRLSLLLALYLPTHPSIHSPAPFLSIVYLSSIQVFSHALLWLSLSADSMTGFLGDEQAYFQPPWSLQDPGGTGPKACISSVLRGCTDRGLCSWPHKETSKHEGCSHHPRGLCPSSCCGHCRCGCQEF